MARFQNIGTLPEPKRAIAEYRECRIAAGDSDRAIYPR